MFHCKQENVRCKHDLMAKSQRDLLRVMQKEWLLSGLKPSLNTWLLFSEDSLEQGTILFKHSLLHSPH